MLYLGLKIKYCLKMLPFEWNLNLPLKTIAADLERGRVTKCFKKIK